VVVNRGGGGGTGNWALGKIRCTAFAAETLSARWWEKLRMLTNIWAVRGGKSRH